MSGISSINASLPFKTTFHPMSIPFLLQNPLDQFHNDLLFLLEKAMRSRFSYAWDLLKPITDRVGRKYHFSAADLNEEYLMMGSYSPKWKLVSHKLKKSSHSAFDFLKNHQNIKWVSGTNSRMLPILDISATEMFNPSKFCLLPTGDLLRHNIVPLTGERGIGICDHGINNIGISGVGLSDFQIALSFTKQEDRHFPELLSNCPHPEFLNIMKLNVLHTLRFPPKFFDLSKYKKEIETKALKHYRKARLFNNWKKHIHLLDKPFTSESLSVKNNTSLPPGFPVGVSRSNGKTTWGFIIQYAPDQKMYQCLINKKGQKKYLPPSQLKMTGNLTSYASAPSTENHSLIRMIKGFLCPNTRVEEIIELFKTISPYDGLESVSEITNPYPIVWGSKPLRRLQRVESNCKVEVAAMGKLELGKEIIVAFTKKKSIPRLKEWVEKRKLNVAVHSFSTAYYLALHDFLFRGTGLNRE